MSKVLFLLFLSFVCSLASAKEGDILEKSVRYRALECFETRNLPKILDQEDLDQKIAAGELVSLSGKVRLHKDLPPGRACVIPETEAFIIALEQDFRKRFGKDFPINSAARTVEIQEALRRSNPNAAPTHGPLASTHLTGSAIDIGYKELVAAERKWIEKKLAKAKRAGLIQAVRERHQACYHVTVFPDRWRNRKKHETA